MKRGDVILVRFPHPSGQRGKKRPAVVIQSDAYTSTVPTVVVAEVTKNLKMMNDSSCLFIDVSTPEGKATGLLIDSVVSGLVLDTVYTDTVAQVLGSLSPSLLQKFDNCLKVGLGLPWAHQITPAFFSLASSALPSASSFSSFASAVRAFS